MSTNIEQKVMANVGVIYTARRLTSRTALECYVLAVAAFSLTLMVSVSHIAANFTNAAYNINSLSVYLLTAVSQTTHIVQAVLFVATAALAALIADIARSLSHPSPNTLAA